MQSAGNLVIMLQPGTASQDLRQPELADGTLHMADLTLGRGGSLHPLGGLPAHATDHVGMGEGLWSPLDRLGVECGRDWLSNA